MPRRRLARARSHCATPVLGMPGGSREAPRSTVRGSRQTAARLLQGSYKTPREGRGKMPGRWREPPHRLLPHSREPYTTPGVPAQATKRPPVHDPTSVLSSAVALSPAGAPTPRVGAAAASWCSASAV